MQESTKNEQYSSTPLFLTEAYGMYPGQEVLVQSTDPRTHKRIWRLAHLSHITKWNDGRVVYVLTHGSYRREGDPILPFENNKLLLGTEVCDACVPTEEK